MNRFTTTCAMRLFFLLLYSLHFSQSVTAQGIYQNWGATYDGGTDGIGAIFSTDSSGGNLAGRHSFTFISKGANPGFGAMTSYNGKLYGLCTGLSEGALISSLFEYDPTTGIYAARVFIPNTNPEMGSQAQGTLTLYNNQLYGTAGFGGSFGKGELFKYDPATAVYTKLFDFDGNSGNNPTGSLTLVNNKMYGLASADGSSGGILFEYDPVANNYSIKTDLSAADISTPVGGLTLYNGKLYGMSFDGGQFDGGTVFEYDTASNSITRKIDLSTAGGKNPSGSLVVYNDELWGLTATGGGSNAGTLFEYDPLTGIYTKKIDFAQASGANPNGDLIMAGNKMFGLAYNGGTNNAGVLFEYDPVLNIYSKKVDLSKINGSNPAGSLTFFNSTFYGLTSNGGSADAGVIFEYDTASSVYTKKIDFNSSIADYPSGSLTYFNKNLYGTTEEGGPAGSGTIFKYDVAAKTTSVEMSFDTLNGSYPMGDLVMYNDKFYAMTKGGGIYDRGVLFSYDPIAKIYSKLFDFDSTNGGNPLDFTQIDYDNDPLLLYNNKFYGTTHFGGVNNTGVLFEFDPATNTYTKKYDFNYADGLEPSGSLIEVNGKLYGMTARGGITNEGTLFEYDPGTNTYTKKIEFQSPDKLSEESGLSLFNNKLYGVSAYGGDSLYGFLFEYDPAANIYSRKISFDSAHGGFPYCRLLLRNNLFYGVTNAGGVYNSGVVFEYNPTTNVYIKKADFDGTNGSPSDAINLVSIPAVIADGNIGICAALPVFTIDNANNTGWKAITDQNGDAVAEINPNGNDLGTITASLYVQNNPARIAGGLNYLNRSLTITVQNQPATGHPVDVRLYIKKSELDDLINTPNSGISSVNDLVVYKSESTCSNNIANDVVQLNTSAADWGVNYVLTTQVNSFSTFHFSSVSSALPVMLLDFTGTKKNKNENQLDWQTSAEVNSNYFNVERSTDGINFYTAGKLAAAGTSSVKKQYQFIDTYTATTDLFYRLKIVDKDDKFKYSKIIKLSVGAEGIIVSPNPVHNTLTINGISQFSQVQVIDASGKTILQMTVLPGGQYDVSNLRQGIYMLRLVNDNEVITARFIKL